MANITIHAKITGRVQGVGFRWWAQARAEALGLSGWVRNDATGSVSAEFHGPQRDVEAMVAELWSGPGASAVADVQSHRVAGAPSFSGFGVIR